VDDEVVPQADLVREGFVFARNELVVFHQQVMILNEGLAFEGQPGHVQSTPFASHIARQVTASGAAGQHDSRIKEG
jgi:hypothetical protein